jgi:hypothetical protein
MDITYKVEKLKKQDKQQFENTKLGVLDLETYKSVKHGNKQIVYAAGYI